METTRLGFQEAMASGGTQNRQLLIRMDQRPLLDALDNHPHPTPRLPELKSTWARKEEEEGRESLHLPGLFIQKGERGESGLGLSLFTG